MSKNKKQNKSESIFGLAKIPVTELLRYSRIEVGQLKSYIQELEYSISLKDKKIKQLEKSLENYKQRYTESKVNK